MVEQTSMMQRQRLEEKINIALLLLDPDCEMEGTLLGRYTPWEECTQIPQKQLPRQCKYITAEPKVRELLGDEKYFANITPAQRGALYQRALDLMQEAITKAGRSMDTPMTSGEYRWFLNQCIYACPPLALKPPTAVGKQKKPKKKPPVHKAPKFVKPTQTEISAYCKEKGYNVNPAAFMAHYESNGWKVGKTKMAKWRSALAGWHIRGGSAPGAGTVGRGINQQPLGRPVKVDILQQGGYAVMKKRNA